MKFYAHTANDGFGKPLPENSGKWQPLDVHLRNVADLAQEFAAPLGLAPEAELAGLLHDLGKYAERFQLRLHNPAVHGVNHWAVGTAHAATLKAWSVAFAADGHHTGIPALHDTETGTPLKTTVSSFADTSRRLELTGQCPEDAATLLARFKQDGLALPPFSPRAIRKEQRFEEALRTRMLFSCLVDADFLDTEAHFDASQTAKRTVPDLEPERALQILRQCLDAKPTAGPVNALRKQLLHDCWSAAAKSHGLFTLTAPTGSGKTLSSLAFALQHIVHHNARLVENDPHRFRRIIVVIPFTSIIEQTAAFIANCLSRSSARTMCWSIIAPLRRANARTIKAAILKTSGCAAPAWRRRIGLRRWSSPPMFSSFKAFSATARRIAASSTASDVR